MLEIDDSLSLLASRAPWRARLAAALSAAALVGVASPAAAEEPLRPTADVAPLVVAPTARRRPALMYTGMAFVGTGVVVSTVGAVIALAAHNGPPGSEDNGDEQRFRGLMVGAVGLGVSFIGIPLWVIGG